MTHKMTSVVVSAILGAIAFTARAAEPATAPTSRAAISGPIFGTTHPVAVTPATAPAAKVSREAAAVLSKVSNAYSKLKTLQQAGNLNGNFDVDGQKNEEKADFTSTFAAPNQFRHEVKDAALVGSTGEKFYIYTVGRNLYLMADAPKGKVMTSELPEPFSQLVEPQNLSLALALSKDPAAELAKTYQNITKTDDVKVDDKPYTALNLANEKGPSAQLLIDPATSLLRRAVIDLSADLVARGAPAVKKAQVTIDYTSTVADTPTKPDQFAWAPPAGAKDANQDAADEASTEVSKALVGKPAPELKLKGADDKEVSLADLKGSVVVLDFWATWCGPCVASLPDLDKLYQEQKGAGVKFFAVNQGEDKKIVDEFVKSKNLSIPVLLDTDTKVGHEYMADQGIPLTIVIGKDGVIKKAIVGAGPNNEKEILAAVTAAQ